MKFNKETIEAAVERMTKDPFWRDLYENAPDGAKRRLRVAFWGNVHLREREDLDAYRAERERIEGEMTLEDARYLAMQFPNGVGKKHYLELMERIRRRPMMTDAKLDEAMDVMCGFLPPRDAERIAATRRAFEGNFSIVMTRERLWAAVGGNGEACALVGDCFNHGHGVDRDEPLAFYWFMRGALGGDGACCARVSEIFQDESSPRFNMEMAIFWLSEGHRRGSSDVKYELGRRLTFGEGPWVKYRNPQAGARLLEECLADDPCGYAHYMYARCLEEGVGVERDVDAAIDFYQISSERGYSWADEALDRLLADGRGREAE